MGEQAQYFCIFFSFVPIVYTHVSEMTKKKTHNQSSSRLAHTFLRDNFFYTPS